MRNILKVLALSSVLGAGLAYATPQSLDDETLSAVTGGEGIAVDVDFRMNTNADGSHNTADCDASTTAKRCYLALQFANRGGGSGEWVVFKGVFGWMTYNTLFIDGTKLPASATSNTYYDASRFQDSTGTCILTGCDPSNLPALQLGFPGGIGTTEQDLKLYLNIPRVAVEYGATGYSADSNGSFLGLRVTDMRAGVVQAQADIDGTIKLFGF